MKNKLIDKLLDRLQNLERKVSKYKLENKLLNRALADMEGLEENYFKMKDWLDLSYADNTEVSALYDKEVSYTKQLEGELIEKEQIIKLMKEQNYC